MDYAVQDFEKDVLEASRQMPVLVDFWAEWCGPCRMLGPVLEKLAAENGERWTLAKVDTEQFPDIARQYGVQGIPNVKLFVDGKPVNEFTGALPEHAIRLWLNDALPDSFARELAEARALREAGNNDEASSILKRILERDGTHEAARTLLAAELLFSAPERALELTGGILEDSSEFELAEGIRTLARLLRMHYAGEELPEGEHSEVYSQAIDATAAQEFDKALELFIEMIRRNRYYDDDGARRACIGLFKLLGEEHEITLARRREFGSALYV